MFVLLHELGHIFGVSHSGDARNIMGASFPNSLVKSSDPTYFDNIRYQPEYFTYSVEQHPVTCAIPSQAKRVLGLTEPCVKVELLDSDIRIL